MGQPIGPTLGEMRDKLAVRLGFGAQLGGLGDGARSFETLLEEAQAELWRAHDFALLHADVTATLGEGQHVLDYPDDCDPQRIFGLWARTGGRWQGLQECAVPLDFLTEPEALPVDNPDAAGVFAPRVLEVGHWTPVETRLAPRKMGVPEIFERRDQLFMAPAPAGQMLLRMRYLRRVGRFTQAADRVTLDADLVHAYALAKGLEDYGRAGAGTAAAAMQQLLGQLRRGEHGIKRYSTVRAPWQPEVMAGNVDRYEQRRATDYR